MNVAWVTPYNTRSAIGRFSRMLAGALSDIGHAVTIVRCETLEVLNGSDVLAGTEVVRWGEVFYRPDFWDPFDTLVYNIGDHYPFHAGVLDLLPKYPGVGIFHDYFLLSLFLGWRNANGGHGAADRILDDLYGEGAALRLHAANGLADWYEYTGEHFPMTEWIAQQVHGAVANSNSYAERLKRWCGGPVLATPPAAAWAQQAFSVEAYVARLVPFLEDSARLRPALRTAADFGHLLTEIGLRPDDPAVARLATLMTGLFVHA